MGDLNIQTVDIGYELFGVKYLELGLTKKDQDINERLKIYRELGKELINKRIDEIKKKIENGIE